MCKYCVYVLVFLYCSCAAQKSAIELKSYEMIIDTANSLSGLAVRLQVNSDPGNEFIKSLKAIDKSETNFIFKEESSCKVHLFDNNKDSINPQFLCLKSDDKLKKADKIRFPGYITVTTIPLNSFFKEAFAEQKFNFRSITAFSYTIFNLSGNVIAYKKYFFSCPTSVNLK